jgi:hypothetical protein
MAAFLSCFLNKKYRASLRVCILPVEGQYTKQICFSNSFENASDVHHQVASGHTRSSPASKKAFHQVFFLMTFELSHRIASSKGMQAK